MGRKNKGKPKFIGNLTYGRDWLLKEGESCGTTICDAYKKVAISSGSLLIIDTEIEDRSNKDGIVKFGGSLIFVRDYNKLGGPVDIKITGKQSPKNYNGKLVQIDPQAKESFLKEMKRNLSQ